MSAPIEHASADTLADLAENELSGPRASAVREHLSVCTSCRETYADLVALPALLAAAGPPTIPPDVTNRVVAALEREAERRFTYAAPTGRPVRPDLAGGRWRTLLPRLGGGLLAGAAALGVGFVLVQGLGQGGDEDSPDFGLAPVQDGDQEVGGGDEPAATSGGTSDTQGLSYGRDTLEGDIQRLLATGVPPGPSTSLGSSRGVEPRDSSAEETTDPNAPTGLAYCVDLVVAEVDPDPAVLAADIGSYEGRPAVVVVLTDPGDDSAPLDVWIVRPSCLAAAVVMADDPPEVVYRATIDR